MLHRNDYVALSVGREYLGSVYWALTTLTTVGYGDISARTTEEQVRLSPLCGNPPMGSFREKRPHVRYVSVGKALVTFIQRIATTYGTNSR